MINIQHMSCVTFRRYRKGMEIEKLGDGKVETMGNDTGDDTEGKVHVTLSVW